MFVSINCQLINVSENKMFLSDGLSYSVQVFPSSLVYVHHLFSSCVVSYTIKHDLLIRINVCSNEFAGSISFAAHLPPPLAFPKIFLYMGVAGCNL